MKVLELKGYKSLKALNAFSTLMLGLKMLPSYMTQTYEEFLGAINLMPPEDQEKMIREAALFVELQKDEIEALMSFCADDNGVPYGPAHMKSLGPQDFIEIIVAVCMEIAKIKVSFITDAEKKK
jgi:hypothetical protein